MSKMTGSCVHVNWCICNMSTAELVIIELIQVYFPCHSCAVIMVMTTMSSETELTLILRHEK